MYQALIIGSLVLGQPLQPHMSQPLPGSLTAAPAVVQPASQPVVQPVADPISMMRSDRYCDSLPAELKRTDTIVGTPYPLKATPGDDPFSGSVTLNQDSFFGFYPILNGSYAITDRIALTFYGLFWTNPGFTPSGTGGTGLWTEVAAGVSFTVFDDALTVNPAVGFLSGRLLSGAPRARPFDGIVAQISFSHAGQYTEAQVFGAYYVATSAPSNNEFAHWWATAGVRPLADRSDWLQIFSVGAHFEQLYQVKARGGTTGNIYTWLGPYVQLTLPNNVFLRMNAGWDLQDDVSGNFYKATLGFVF